MLSDTIDGGLTYAKSWTLSPNANGFLDDNGMSEDLARGVLDENPTYTYRYRYVGPGIPVAYSVPFTAQTALLPPSDVTAAGDGNGGTYVSWTNVSLKASGYRVSYKQTTDTAWTALTDLAATADHLHVTNVALTSTTQFKVESIDPDNVADAAGPTVTGPSAATITAATTTTLTVHFPAAANRVIQRSLNEGLSWSDDIAVGSADWTDDNAGAGLPDGSAILYRYRTTSADQFSDAVAGHTTLAAPANVSAAASDTDTIHVSWDDLSAVATTVVIEISDDAGATWATAASLGVERIDADFPRLEAGATYSIRLRATSAEEQSAYSPVVTATTYTTMPTVTLTGAGSVATGSPYTISFSAAWEDFPAAQPVSWDVDWGDGTPAQTLDGAATSASHQFPPGVNAACATVNAEYSGRVSVLAGKDVSITGVSAPSSPMDVKVQPWSSDEIDLSWANPADDARTTTVWDSIDGGVTWNDMVDLPAGETEYSAMGLDFHPNYLFKVTNVNDAGSSSAASGGLAVGTLDSPIVQASNVTATSEQLDMTWNGPVDTVDLNIWQAGCLVPFSSGSMTTVSPGHYRMQVTGLPAARVHDMELRVNMPAKDGKHFDGVGSDTPGGVGVQGVVPDSVSVPDVPVNAPSDQETPPTPQGVRTFVCPFEPSPTDWWPANQVHVIWKLVNAQVTGYAVRRTCITDPSQPEKWLYAGSTGSVIGDTGMLPGKYRYDVYAMNHSHLSPAGSATANVWPPGFLAAFDGTLDYDGKPGRQTMIATFKNKYHIEGGGDKVYEEGAGVNQHQEIGSDGKPVTVHTSNYLDAATGDDAVAKIDKATAKLIKFYQDAENRRNVPVDVIGYSRGAFQAVKFANDILAAGIPDFSSKYTYHKVVLREKSGNVVTKEMFGYHHYFDAPKFRFMGLISPVGQMGPLTIIGNILTLGHEQINDNWPGGISDGVVHVCQLLSSNEDRALYPQTTMQFNPAHSTEPYPGKKFDYDHEFIGLADAVGKTLIDDARAVNVPLEPK